MIFFFLKERLALVKTQSYFDEATYEKKNGNVGTPGKNGGSGSRGALREGEIKGERKDRSRKGEKKMEEQGEGGIKGK